jgi:3-oxoacyl-[acyl-carrier protein] reductase/7-alpha-hydroxysteroid dehydrogenase
MDTSLNYFHRKRVIVTGGYRGIGFATVQEFLRHGARVSVIGRTRVEANVNTLQHYFAPSSIQFLECDLRSEAALTFNLQQAIEFLGGVDILINAAGIISNDEIEFVEPRQHDLIMDVNLRSAHRVS